MSATSLMENGFMTRQQALCIIGHSVHFLVIKLVAKGMEGRISYTKNGIGKLRGVRFQGIVKNWPTFTFFFFIISINANFSIADKVLFFKV